MPDGYVAVATARQIPVGRSIGVTVAGQSIALFNLGGEVVAVENRCPHQGAPLAGSPILGASRVRCALHGWLFDLRGSEEDDGLRRYPARLGNDGVIEVAVEEAARGQV
jgi:3-phenylpropionate/trans-cinnamate dioxygenase ferredoxin subunit